jgi:uncharacterized GH25 family protein
MPQSILRHIAFVIAGALGLSISTAHAGETSADPLQWQARATQHDLNLTLQPGKTPIPVGRHHHWLALLKRDNGTPVQGARLTVTGGMRGHGHGMPSQPLVKATDQPGVYRIDGMLFNMYGQWNILVHVKTSNAESTIDIPIELDY